MKASNRLIMFLLIFVSFPLFEASGQLGMPPTVVPGAVPELIYSDDLFFEGPSWDPQTERFYFVASGQDRHRLLCMEETGEVSIYLEDPERINGTFLGRDGDLLCAQVYGHRILSCSLTRDGVPEVKELAHNPAWNQPNDLCQSPRGDIYFTDPDFHSRSSSAVYMLPADGGPVRTIITDMPLPNGLITSNDGRQLYVADSHKKHWKVYPIHVQTDRAVGIGKVFFEPKTISTSDPDGMTIDEHGNLYFTGRGGIWVVSPQGRELGFVAFEEFCSNVTFGGKDGTTLFVTCKGAVYRLAMAVRGGQFTWGMSTGTRIELKPTPRVEQPKRGIWRRREPPEGSEK